MARKSCEPKSRRRAGPWAHLARFGRSEDGSWTIEAVIWTPILVALMAFSVNMSTVFFNEAQILSVVQNVARAHSLGRYEDDLEAEADIQAQLAYLDASYSVDAMIDGPLVTASVTIAATELMPMNFMTSPFAGFVLDIKSQQLVEY